MPGPKVLLVDNSPVILKIVSTILERLGCEVRTAGDGLEAFDLLPIYRPEMIFTDLVMPKIDGAKLCFLVRNTEQLRDIFLVVLSGIAMEDDANILQLGADMCIAKGPPLAMEANIRLALDRYASGERGGSRLYGMDGLYPREVTSELLSNMYHVEVILEKMSEGVVELDQGGRVIKANPAALAIFHTREQYMLTTLFSANLPDKEGRMVQAWVDGLDAESREALEFDYSNPIALGDRLVTLYLAPMREEDSFFMTGLLSDVTQRKEADARERALEHELERMKRLDAMSMMASGISHDFNNLLTIINGNLELARLFCDKDSRLLNLLDESDRAMSHAMSLIRQFTSFSDTCLPRCTELRIGPLLRDLLKYLFQDSPIEVSYESESPLFPVSVDSSQMIQVFTNVLQNSAEALGEAGGTITIRLANQEIPALPAEPAKGGNKLQPGHYVQVTIQDNGPGMSQEVMEHAFDPYFSTKQKGVQKGMGLGLTIVHAIVKKHGGQVQLGNRPQGGLRVRILLPAAETACKALLRGRPKRVLIMDDDAMIRMVSIKMLEHLGCQVDQATDGAVALQMMHEASTSGDCYDLVILDLQVDDGMGALETARHCRNLYSHPILVVTSGDANSDAVHDPGKYGFAASIVKPFSLEDLDELLTLTKGKDE